MSVDTPAPFPDETGTGTAFASSSSLEELRARRKLLYDHPCSRDHCEAPVVQLLVLHRQELRWIRRLQPERIEAKVARLEIGTNAPHHAALLGQRPGKERRCLEAEDRKDFRNRDREHHRRPERLERGFLEREVSRHVDVAAEERVEVLANQEAERSEHPNTPVLQFHLAVEFDLALRDVVRRAEAKRIEETHRRENPGELLRVSLAVKFLRSLAVNRRLLSTDREHEKLVLRRQLLRDHAGRRDHGKPPVLQLLRLHLLQLLRIRRLQPERIEAQVARLEIGPNLPRHAALFALLGKQSRRLEAEDRIDLGNRDREHHRRPERLERGLLEREVSRHVDVAAEERVEVLANQEAERSEHPDTAVLQFHLAVEFDLALRDVVRRAKPKRIEETHRRENPGELLRVSLAVKLLRSLAVNRRLLSTNREHEELLIRRQLLRDHA